MKRLLPALLISIFTVFIYLANPIHVHAEDLKGWGQTRWDMTREELTTLLSDRIKEIDEYQTEVKTMHLQETKIGNFRTGIRLKLKNNQLVRVMLDVKTNNKNSEYNSQEYIEFKGMLIHKYGEPDITKINRMKKTGWILNTETYWFLGPTTVTLIDFGSSFFTAYAPSNIKNTGDL